MVSKNNRIQRIEQTAERQSHFGIRKLTVGAASVLLGTTLWLGNNANVASADTIKDNSEADTQESTHTATVDTKNVDKVVVAADQNKIEENNDATEKSDSNDVTNSSTVTNGNDVEKAAQTSEASDTAKVETEEANANSAQTQTEKSVNDLDETKQSDTTNNKVAEKATEKDATQKAADVHVANATENTKNKQAEQQTQTQAAKETTKAINNAAQDGKNSETNSASVGQELEKAAQAGKNTEVSQNDLTTDTARLGQVVEATKSNQDSQKDNKTQELKIGDLTSGLTADALKANLTKGNEALVDRATINALSAQNRSIDPSKELASSKLAMLGLNLMAVPTSTGSNNDDAVTVKDWNSFQSALNSGKKVNIDGNITAYGDVSVYGNATISGTDGSTLNLGQYTITNNSNLTLKDLTINGSIMGNGTVNIQGTVTSNVNTQTVPTSDQFSAQGYKGNRNNYSNSNIVARQVNVENGATLNINSSQINDGINLTSGGSVNVGDNATLNINLSNNSSSTERYHVAGIYANSNGSVTTGRNSTLNLNTGSGQGIAMTGTRPVSKDSDRFGGYGTAQSRPNGSGQINLGQYSTFNFTGRDGVILGDNSNFNVGEYANVHFENRGRGVALDLANNANINIGDHAVTYFHSVGKTGTSGSYDGYNYIGVNEAGNITVGEDATFRVILEGRGDNPWDDVVQLDSRNANTNAAFTSKKGAIVDIRDDNTNFYAELISFPLGNPNSRINIQDPLLLNLQRYSAGGATTGWMAGVGGTDINSTSSQYTANLIYMGGTKGILTIGGTDYVVYQQIKSNGAQQIWTDVNSVQFNKHGFASGDIYNNGANPDLSINGQGLVGGIRANQIRDNETNPTQSGLQNSPAYGISTMRASHQIWIPHETSTQIKGTHTNTIKYVYEDGSPVLDANGQPLVVTQDLNLTRDLTLDLTADQIKTVQDYALNHSADEVLDYIRSGYSVTQDSGWKMTNDQGQTVTNPYAAVTSPVEQGYTATIQSTNAPGVTVGGDGSSVKANFTLDAANDVVQNGMLSAAYRDKGITGIPNNYETVVVYKKAAEKGSVTVNYHDDTTNTTIPNTQYTTGSVDAGTPVTYTTTQTITNLESQGYVYVTTDGTIPSTIEGNQNVVVTVHMKHGVQPVTPDTPTPDVPKNTPAEAQPDQLTKKVNLTVNYVNNDGSTFTATVPANAKQTATFTGTAYVDKVTGQLVNATQQNGQWVIDENNTATPQITWTSDKTSFDMVVSPVEQNYHLVDVSSHRDGNNVAAITGLTKDSGDITVTVTYAPNGKIIPVDPSGNPIPDAPTPQYPTDPTDPSKVTPNEPVPNVPGYIPSVPTVTPTDPGKDTPVPYTKPAPEDQTVDSKQTVHYIDGDTNTALREDSTNGTFTFVKSGQTGQWNADSHKFENVDAPVIDGYVAEKRTYEGQTSTPTDPNKEITIIYHKIGKIIPVDPSGKPIPDAPTPSYTNDPTDPTKVTPNEPTPNVPGWTTNIPNVTPEVPTKDTNVPYTKPTPTPEDQTVTVKYFDDTVGEGKQDLSSYDKTITGKPGTPLDYSTQPSITELENKGFKLVSDNFNVTTMPENGGSYEVHFIHNTTTITPGKPGKPGEPINPNDPDGPKWPDGTDAKSLTKNGSQTVHYVYSDGTKAADDNVQNTQFEHTLVFDNVTGKQIEDKGWSPESHKFNDVTSPTIDGYHADKTSVEGATVTPDNPTSETTVTYTKNGEEIRNKDQKDASQVVRYVDDQGNELHASASQTFQFSYSGDTYDKQTNTLISNGKWNATSHDFTAADVPVIDGYVAVSGYTNNNGKYTAGGFTTTPEASDAQRNRIFTVVYKKVGKIVPVGPDGKTPIPDAPTPSYPNDPTDPTKVTPNEPVPTIPGYTPSTPTVTPSVPTEDTPVPYTPETPAKDQVAIVNYVDADENNQLITTSGNLTGKAGTKIDYSTAPTIKDLENKGYVLVNDGFPAGAVYDNDDNTIQTYTVVLKHGTVPVTPTDPGKPGEPINPNDPDGPKWPDGTGEDSLKKTGTQTIHYVYSDGRKAKDDNVQSFDFTKSAVVDKVTGAIISQTGWNVDSHTFGNVDTPVIDGYHADKRTAGGTTITPEDLTKEVTVTYTPNGKIIPVDPNGNPIPNVPTPQYPTDPTDPTKVVPDEPVPTIPGYTPSTPTVTPTDPGKDTPVPYTPETPAKDQVAIVNYVDADEGNKVITTSGDLTGKAGAKIDYSTKSTIQDLENKGYVLVNDGFPAGAVYDNDDNTTQTYTVVLKHGTVPVTPTDPGKPGEPINPNDPDGPKWPDGTGEDSLKKTGTQTIHYVYSDGRKAKDDNVQSFDFTKSAVVDKVTGAIISQTGWNVDSHTFGNVDTPVIDGYHADKRTAGGTTITPEDLTKEVTVTYTPNGKIIPVDPNGKPIPNVPTPQYPTDPTDPTKVVPDEPVPTIPGYTPSTPTVTPTDPGKDTPVPYTPETPAKDQVAIVNYVDSDEGNKLITTSGDLTGKAGTKIDYSTTSTIQDLENKGYVLVNDGFPAGAVYDNDDNTTQIYTVVLKHGTTTITPDKPGKPGEPINPNDPDGPKWPDNTGENSLTKTGTQTIHYVYSDGRKAKDDNVQSFDFTKSAVVDKVTGAIISQTGWNVDSHTFGNVDTPVIDGYHADKRTAGGTTITPEDLTKEVTVTYTPNGKIIPVDPNGKPIPNVPTPTYPTDPSDPTKVVPDEPVPTIPGMTPSTPTVTPTDPGKDTPVPYNPVVNDKGEVNVFVHDNTTGQNLTDYGYKSGSEDVGTKVSYNKDKVITELTNKGYKVINPDVTIPGEIAKGTTNVTIYVEHDLVPVTPDKPGKPGEPINPNDPNGPKWPDNTGENSLKKTGTQTIHYTGAGNKTPKDDVQSFTFTKTMVVDKVTGKVVDSGKWNVTSHTFGNVDTPVVDGYHADKRTAGGTTITPEDLNKTVTVNYSQNGKIIPVDPNGNPIPNVPTPQYPTDPSDPTKVVPDEPVPTIPGMTPSTPTVTPTDPGKDTPVPYNPVVNDKGEVNVFVHDNTTGQNLTDYEYKSGSEDVGTKVSYDKDKVITELTNKGYKVINPDVTIPGEIAKGTTNVTIYVEHDLVPVNPTNPGKPGEPINPNDPNGPKWPDNTGENSLKKTGKQTIHYTGAGNNTPKDNVTTTEFNHEVIVDKVTGKIVKDNGWTPSSHTFGTVDTPVVDGYHADKRTAGGKTVTVENPEVTDVVNYSQNGKIIPVDPSGKPIPNVPTPTYPTDPTDPTRVVPDEPVPTIPGYTPSQNTVTPTDPGKDTPVVYNKNVTPTPDVPTPDTVTGKQTINFVDGDNGNTPLRDPNVQTHKFTNGESSYTFGTITVPVIDGYVAEVKTAGGKTVTPDNPDANVTVVYHKIGKIVPVDPNGNPIPDAPTPSYKNDPTDPTRVVPNEPVPELPGYTPSENSVTPVDPTKDTKVVYTKPDNSDTIPPHAQDDEPTPVKPAKPAKKDVPNKQNETLPPHATDVDGAQDTVKPHGAKPVEEVKTPTAGNAKKISTPVQKQNEAKTLPQTGEKDNEVADVAGGLAAGLGLIGLAGVKKRKKEEE
ncbi:mucin-binding protein [Lactobacillus intestinalis]|uniref:mucin-binding protein n=2 Tax=Lactobacillus intestinalis TaxID=151781 RepID=UPI001C3EF7AC|nr:YSIRK-type signal peptide-containing protein [Lactobacillus intestinalis]